MEPCVILWYIGYEPDALIKVEDIISPVGFLEILSGSGGEPDQRYENTILQDGWSMLTRGEVSCNFFLVR